MAGEAKKKQADDDEFDIELEEEEASSAEQEDEEPDADEDQDASDDDTEAEEYSKKVQKRIDRLTYERAQAQREAEEARKLQEEAVSYAKQVQAQHERLRREYDQGSDVLYKQAEGRIDAQIASAKRDLRDAHDEGDSEKIVEAQYKLSELTAEKSRLASYKRRPQPKQEQQPQYQPQQKPQVNKPTEMAARWAEQNPWFNEDARMTAYAFGVHEDLIKNHGVKPDTEEYYRQIDKAMRETFPTKFSSGADEEKPSQRERETVVTPPSRKSAKKPRTVRLSPTQVALARRLGITNEQYAAQLMKEQGKT